MSKALSSLVESLRIVALGYDDQLRYLANVGLDQRNIDEIALQFDDNFRMLPLVCKENAISSAAVDCINDLNSILDNMSNNEENWTPEAMRESRAWETARATAFRCLLLIEEPKRQATI